MLNAIKMFGVAMVVAASVSSALAAVTYDAGSGQRFESNGSYGISTDRNALVEATGN